MKEFLSEHNIDYKYVDITESMFNLKSFLKYRDREEVFDNIKRKNRIGIPVIMINNGQEFFFSIDEDNLDKLRE